MNRRILFLAQLPPPVHGAALMNERALSVIQQEFQSYAINLSNANSLADVGRFSLRKILSIARLYCDIFFKIIELKPDAAYFALCPTGSAFYRDALIAFLLKLFRIPIIYHLHGRGIADAHGLTKRLYSAVFSNTDVIHLSSVFWPELETYIEKDRFYVVPNCTESSMDFSPSDKHEEHPVRFLYLSNYLLGKGPLYLLDAVKILFDKGIKCHIKMAGDWYDNDLKVRVDNWLKENAEIVNVGVIQIGGPVYGKDKHTLFAESDVLVFPSYIDTFPLVLLEAQAAGLAIISTDAGAIPEILDQGKAGIICPQHDAIALADKMQLLTENRNELKSLQNAAFRRYKENYTEASFALNFIGVVHKIMSLPRQ